MIRRLFAQQQKRNFSSSFLQRSSNNSSNLEDVDFVSRGVITPKAVMAKRMQISPSYFTGKPLLHDTFYKLDALLDKTDQEHQQEQMLQQETVKKSVVAWVPKTILEKTWKFNLTADEYQNLIQKLNQLYKRNTMDTEVKHFLERFMVGISDKQKNQSSDSLDEWGRAYAVGLRRRIRAHVWLSESQNPLGGRIMVDGRDYLDVFGRFMHRARVIMPFEVTDTMLRYNVWCQIENASRDPTGQGSIADALANGISHALLLFNPNLEEPLKQGIPSILTILIIHI